jgi:hypothetical protein
MSVTEKPAMTAAFVRAALRRRHPATARMGGRMIPGPWTCIEEYRGIDLLALAANASPSSGASRSARYPRVGYEVKVSRSDFRHELLHPGKRAAAVAFCNEFYLATPKGLLSAEEVAFSPPDWLDDPLSFQRPVCPNGCRTLGRKRKTHFVWVADSFSHEICPVCKGKGSLERSRVEREAPTLWVPRELGLVEIDGRGCRVRKAAPVRTNVGELALSAFDLGTLVRWVSARPDPRHAGVVEGARERGREFTALDRKRRGLH